MKKIIIANWKMNTTIPEGLDLATQIRSGLSKSSCQVVLCPPATHLKPLFDELQSSSISLGAQDMHWQDRGAYTGAISATQIEEYCDFVILGHSEMRKYSGETDEDVFKKVAAALRHSITPILCVGEGLDTKKSGKNEEFVKQQLKNILSKLFQISVPSSQDFIIVYEPIWAISTNPGAKPDTPENAQKMVELIKREIENNYKVKNITFRYVYGGSVNSGNAAALAKSTAIEGALVGAASLNAAEFIKVVNLFA